MGPGRSRFSLLTHSFIYPFICSTHIYCERYGLNICQLSAFGQIMKPQGSSLSSSLIRSLKTATVQEMGLNKNAKTHKCCCLGFLCRIHWCFFYLKWEERETGSRLSLYSLSKKIIDLYTETRPQALQLGCSEVVCACMCCT